MGTIVVNGGRRLNGQLFVQGSKNAVLPILAATILTREPCYLRHVPAIKDVQVSLQILSQLGGRVTRMDGSVHIENAILNPENLTPTLASKMRSSILFSGACLSAYGYSRLDKPGGCLIGERPIGMRLQCFRDMGAHVEEHDTYTILSADRLQGCIHHLRLPSVGVTENVLLAAVLAEGTTIIRGAAREPEIVTLCQCLRKAGARIAGEGSSQITVQGVEKLHGFVFHVPADRIVAATYLCSVMATGGSLWLSGVNAWEMDSLLRVLERMGAEVEVRPHSMHLQMKGKPVGIPFLQTGYYPELPTDVQSLLLIPLCLSKGAGEIEERIFENRFRIVPELQKMGAVVHTDGNRVRYEGVEALHGTAVRAAELRGGAALVMAGLAAQGQTVISGIEYIERGYENLVGDLKRIGADIYYER